MPARVTIVEPTAGAFIHTLFVLVEELCHAAENDLRSPRYCFAFASWEIVEPVRQIIMTTDRAMWHAGDPRIRTDSGQVVMAGPRIPLGWVFARAVVVCSDWYPTIEVMESLADEVIFVFDPQDPPRRAMQLRAMASGGLERR